MLLLAWMSLAFWHSVKPLPPGVHLISQTSRLSDSDVEFLYESPRHRAPSRDLSAIDRAEQLIVLDRSPVPTDLAQHLLGRKRLRPTLKIVLVTDSGRATSGAAPAQNLAALERAGIVVARVRLDRLRDPNPLYSGLWRLAFGWWNDPFDETPGLAPLAAWARLQNFKSDQRQLMVADDGSGGWIAIVAPAGASPSLIVRGLLAHAMIAGELQIAGWSTDDDRLPLAPQSQGRGVGSVDARFLTEGAIESALLDALQTAGGADRVQIAVDDLSDRRLITAALRAAARGARLQVLLGRNPMPNQPVAAELLREGAGRIQVRWYPEGLGGRHPSLLVLRHGADVWVNFGSANFTRRDLGDLNLAASVELRMPARAAAAQAAIGYFDAAWAGASADTLFAETSAAAYWRYRLAEASGLSRF